MAEAGADVVLVPSCTERISGYHRVRTGSMARALENTIATVQSPTVGDAPWSPAVDFNAGAAGIYVPSEHGVSDDGVLAQGKLNASEWVIGQDRSRPPAPCPRDRRNAQLRRLVQPAGRAHERRQGRACVASLSIARLSVCHLDQTQFGIAVAGRGGVRLDRELGSVTSTSARPIRGETFK